MGSNRLKAVSFSDDVGLELARANFEPLRILLDVLANHIAEYNASYRLQPREEMHPIARHTYEVRYLLVGCGAESLALTFTICGIDSDKILFHRQRQTYPRPITDCPTQTDPRVYGLNEVVGLMRVVQDRVITHLSS